MMALGAPLPATQRSFLPPRVTSLAETGLDPAVLGELALKTIYHARSATGAEVAAALCLPYSKVVEPVIDLLRQQHYLEVRGSTQASPLTQDFQFLLTARGEQRVQEILRHSTYHGPCPVVFSDYVYGVRRQSIRDLTVPLRQLQQVFEPLVIAPRLLFQVGLALNSGGSIFLFGPPGNGKTTIAEFMARCLGGAMYLPHAVYADGQIIQVFDGTVHRPVPGDNDQLDRRWVHIQRPFIVVGGELTMSALDLSRSAASGIYDAPVQMKANGGLLLIDDFGRQRIAPAELLNRWIIPLASRVDYLHLATGGTLKVPFDQLIVFATNLEPRDLVDAAFLRRIRYKIQVPAPGLDQLREMFRRVAASRGLAYNDSVVDHLIADYYHKRSITPQATHAPDLIDAMITAARFLGRRPEMNRHLLDLACESYFVEGTT